MDRARALRLPGERHGRGAGGKARGPPGPPASRGGAPGRRRGVAPGRRDAEDPPPEPRAGEPGDEAPRRARAARRRIGLKPRRNPGDLPFPEPHRSLRRSTPMASGEGHRPGPSGAHRVLVSLSREAVSGGLVMDGMFPYTESARRKARKEKALQEGLLSGVLPESPEEAAHPQNPLEYRVMNRSAKKSPAQKRPAAPGARAAAVRAPGARSPNAPAVKPGAPKAHPARNAPPRPGSPRRPQGAGGVHVNPERLLLETQALDLFGTGKRGHVAICPDCHHEIVKVVCL